MVSLYNHEERISTFMDSFILEQPTSGHEIQYIEMMDEWDAFGGRLNPGALSRFSNSQQRNVTYPEWLKWIDEDKKAGQWLYFFINNGKILGAITIRPKKNMHNIGLDCHCLYGIRPTERNKGYATKMLQQALPIMKSHRINPVVITCDKENIGSSKVILKNGGLFVEEVIDEKTGRIIHIYNINCTEEI